MVRKRSQKKSIITSLHQRLMPAAPRSIERPAFDKIVTPQLIERLRRIAASNLINTSDVGDAVQVALLAAQRTWVDFEWRSDPFTWFTAILINKCRTFNMQRLHTKVTVLDENAPTGDRWQDILLDREEVATILNKLPASDRDIIALYYFWNLTYEQLAAKLGGTSAQAEVRLSKARRKFRNEWFKNHPEDDGQ